MTEFVAVDDDAIVSVIEGMLESDRGQFAAPGDSAYRWVVDVAGETCTLDVSDLHSADGTFFTLHMRDWLVELLVIKEVDAGGTLRANWLVDILGDQSTIISDFVEIRLSL